MASRCVTRIATAFLIGAWLCAPAYAQRQAPQGVQQVASRKPVVEYIALTVLIVAPILMVCRSSRRST